MDEKVSKAILSFRKLVLWTKREEPRFLFPVSHRLWNLVTFIYGCYVPLNVKIGDGTIFPHGLRGVFFAGGTKIGNNCVIFHQVTLGSNYHTAKGSSAGAPVIGNNVLIGVGAKVIGKISIGDNCRIGANCVVFKNAPPNSTIVMDAPRVLTRQSATAPNS